MRESRAAQVYGGEDPIAALATPLGESALALVRTAGGTSGGESAITLLAKIFSRPEKLLSAPPDSLVHGWIIDSRDGKRIDEVMVSVYRAPRSYTGEDGADISCHGGIAVVKAVLAALKEAGFRDALPGEFTFRAFMNGKLDLTRAESVMELVSAKTGKGREQAVRRLRGALAKEISEIKSLLVEVLAGTEIYLDYSEDEFSGSGDDEEAGRLPARSLAEKAKQRLLALAENWRRERLYAEGALAVLAGRPNAGKSSLFNYLAREDRAIVTDAPGTTRDWIEVLVSVEDIPLRLADTAGLRSAEAASEAERIGMERSLELVDKADIVLYVIDGEAGITEEDRDFLAKRKADAPQKPVLVLWNKTDLAKPPPLSGEDAELCGRLLAVSAKTGEGIGESARSTARLLEAANGATDRAPHGALGATAASPLGEIRKDAAANSAAGLEREEAFGPGTVRQKELIETALFSVEEALALADREEPLDIIAPLFRAAINALGEITGEVSGADILDAMFSRFCVGK